MPNQVNPYQPPTGNPPESPGLFARLKLWWAAATQFPLATDAMAFERGKPMIWYGVIFQIDLEVPEQIRASLPASRVDAEYIDRVQREACRVATELVETRPELSEFFRERTLLVRIVKSYDDLDQPHHQVLLTPDQWHLSQWHLGDEYLNV